MAKDIRMSIQLGDCRLVADTANYTYDKVCELAERVAEIRSKNSLFAKYPLEENENKEDWAKRIEPKMQEELLRREGEKEEDHLKRIYGAKVDAHATAYGIMNAIAEVLCSKNVTLEDFKRCNWLSAQQFIYDVLSMGMIPCDDFFPRRPLQN